MGAVPCGCPRGYLEDTIRTPLGCPLNVFWYRTLLTRSSLSSSTRDDPTLSPRALRKVNTIPPPITSRSTWGKKEVKTIQKTATMIFMNECTIPSHPDPIPSHPTPHTTPPHSTSFHPIPSHPVQLLWYCSNLNQL